MSVAVQANPTQRLRALADAHLVRSARFELLRAIARREISPAEVALNPPPCMESMVAFDFLRECPGIGVGRLQTINRWAMREGVNLAQPLGEMTPSKRHWLAQVVAAPCRRAVITGPAIACRPQG